VHPKGANSMAASGLVFRSNMVGTGRAISIFFGINGVRNKRSHLVGPPFPEFKAYFSVMAVWHFSRDLTRCLLGCGQSTYLLRMAEITLADVLSLTTQRNRNWGTFNSCRE